MSQLPPLWDHQKKIISMGLELSDLAIFADMGCGKSRSTIEIIRRRCGMEKRLMRVLIFAPKIVLKNWKHEFGMYSKINQSDIIILDKSGKHRADTMFNACFNENTNELSKGKVIITNYEAMEMTELVKIIKDWQPEILVCDEAHRLKNPQSKRAKIVVSISDIANHVYLLTGTPILNSPMDIFNQYRILDGGDTFGKNFYAFRGKYFTDVNSSWAGKQSYFPKWMPRAETYDALNSLMYRKAIRVLKSECLDLPPMVKQKVEVEMSPVQAKMYKEMATEYVTFIESKKKSGESLAVVAQLAITKALRLQQIVSGFAKDVEGNSHRITPCPRLDALSDLLNDLVGQHKVIVWATFKENYAMIGEMLQKQKIPYVELHGDVPQKDRDEAVRRFRQDGDCRVIIANQGAAGIGINLTEASYSIFYSRSFSLEHDLQAEARNYRGGSEIHSSITRIDITTPGTIDELINEALSSKQNVADKILDWRP